MSKMDEIIIVVPKKALFNGTELLFQGTEKSPIKVLKIKNNIERNYGVMRRGDAETNTRYKQPIPYAVISRGDELFLYKRLVGGGEERLHDKFSLGVGGHMNNFDSANIEELLSQNLNRELEEELDIRGEQSVDVIGFINDELDDVGKVHIGLLVMISLPDDAEVEVRETEQLEGVWTTLEELQNPEIYDKLENWSQIVVDTLSEA